MTLLSDILKELRTQYYLGFYPQNVPYSDEPFHRLQVKLSRPDLRVLTRSGYYGDVARESGSPSKEPGAVARD